MSLIQQLTDTRQWKDFLLYIASSGNLTQREESEMVQFVANEEYLPVVERILSCDFPLPTKMLVSKMGSERKRVVYTYPPEENYVLKLLTYLLLRKYDSIFAPNLYSFRERHGVNEAVKLLRQDKTLSQRYVYKVDIHDYFNSVDVDRIVPMIESALSQEPEIVRFLISILTNPKVITNDGSVIEERKGIMAGVPVSAFLANLYLMDMDWEFHNSGRRYMRYSDDIIVFEQSAQARDTAANQILNHLKTKGLEVNPKKEWRSDAQQEWTFLGVKYLNGTFDISDASVQKICDKMRRKYRALIRWRHRKDLEPEKAAKAFIKIFNRKLYDNPIRSDLTWTRWFFPVINTDESLRRIDQYMQQCVRYIMTETHTNRQFNCRYEDLKRLGYRSLVSEYYKQKEQHAKAERTRPSDYTKEDEDIEHNL